MKPSDGSWIVVDGGLKQIDGGEKYVYGVNICDEKLMGLTAGGIFHAGKLSHISASGSGGRSASETQPQGFGGELLATDEHTGRHPFTLV